MSEDADSGRDSIGSKSEMRRMEAQAPREVFLWEPDLRELKTNRAEAQHVACVLQQFNGGYTRFIEHTAFAQACEERDELKAQFHQTKIIGENKLAEQYKKERDEWQRRHKHLAVGSDEILATVNAQLSTIADLRAELIGLRELNSIQKIYLTAGEAAVERLNKERRSYRTLNALLGDNADIEELEALLLECESALDGLLKWAEKNHEMPGYSNCILIAIETLAKIKQMRGGE